MSSRLLILLFISILLACSKAPTSCERCDRDITITPCIDKHRQFKQGVVFNLNSEAVQFIPISQIESFHEVFLIEVDLIAVSERVVLISSEHGNYLLDVFGAVIVGLDEAEDPVVAKFGDRRFFGATESKGTFELDDTFTIPNVVLESTVIEFSINGSRPDSIFTTRSFLSAEDTLVTSRIYFPIQFGEHQIEYLKTEEFRSFYTNETTGEVRSKEEYMRSRWEIYNINDQKVMSQTEWEIKDEIRKPVRASFSDNGLIKAIQETNSSTTLLDNGTQTLLVNDARTPQLSPSGEFMSSSDFNTLEVINTHTGFRFSVSNKSDYSVYNPTGFMRDEQAILLTERKNASSDLRDMAIRKFTFNEFGVTDSSTKFRLINHVSLDSLDYLITRASQPVDLGNNNIFFLLFQHQLSLCDN